MHDVSMNINVDFHEDGRCEGTIICGNRIATIKPLHLSHHVTYEGFEYIEVPEIDIPWIEGPQVVGFIVGNIFGDINPEWALKVTLQMLHQMSGGSSLETVGNA